MISLLDVQSGYDNWAAKPHNAKWVRKIDGTPIPNDIPVSIFDHLRDGGLIEAARIGDAVLSWLVKFDLADAGEEYRAEDVVELLNDLTPASQLNHDLRSAVEGIADDYMTSDNHHPGYVLIPTAKFEAIRSALSTSQSDPAPEIACPCTTFEQDEDCPLGFPSLLCSVCKGTGHASREQVVALAAEMLKVAEQVDELEDPFAAWESIELLKSQAPEIAALRAENKRWQHRYQALCDWYLRDGKRSEIFEHGHIVQTTQQHLDDWADLAALTPEQGEAK
jgi:hypothetical protein